MAIAWIHRKDYKRAGTINLAVLDPGGVLCSQQAAYITGTSITVDGGLTRAL